MKNNYERYMVPKMILRGRPSSSSFEEELSAEFEEYYEE